MTSEQVTQIADAINGVKFALELVYVGILIHAATSGPSMGGVRQALERIAEALRGKR